MELGVDEWHNPAQLERASRRRGVVDDRTLGGGGGGGVRETVWMSNTSQRGAGSHSSRSPSNTSLLHDDDSRWSLVRVERGSNSSDRSRRLQVQDAYTTDLQRCVRETTSRLTRFINSFDEARSRRHDDAESVQRHETARSWRRAGDNCTSLADRALPPLVEALRATITRPSSLNAHMQLIHAALDAVGPGVRLLLSVRQLLREADDDVATVSQLTSLLLAVAESLQRMRRAAQRALAACADEARSRDTVAGSLQSSEEDATHQRHQLVPYRAGAGGYVDTAHLLDDDDRRLTLVAIESCDAAYRQIQSCGACLDQMTSSSSLQPWHRTDYDEEDFQVRLLTKVAQLCYALGPFITKITNSAKDGYVDDFCEAVRRFAGAVSRIIIVIPQMAEGGGVDRTRKLCLSGRAIRHCASSLVTSARQMAAQRHHATSYRAYAEHSRALSRALTHLVHYISADYVDAPPRLVDAR